MFLRVALLVVIGWIGHPVGLLWLGLPVAAAVLRGIVRWEARLLAYHASLTDCYPPFTLETGSVSPAAPSS